MADLEEGDNFDPDEIQAAQDRLSRLGVFRSLRFVEAEEIEPDGSLPITVAVEDRRRRTIGFGGTLSTIDGVGVSAFWQHRNLFGRAEQLRFDAGIDGLGGSLEPRGLRLQPRRHLHPAGRLQPGHQLHHLADRAAGQLRHLPRAVGHRLGGLLAPVRRPADRIGLRRGRRAPATTTTSASGISPPSGSSAPPPTTRATIRSTPTAATISRSRRSPSTSSSTATPPRAGTLEGRVYRSLGQEDQPRPRRPGQGRQLRRRGHRREPARPAVLRRRRRVGARLCLPVDRRRERRCGGGRHRHRRQGALRGLGRGALPHQRQLRGGRLRRTRASSPPTPSLGGDSDLRTGVGLGVRYYTGIGILRADLATPVDPRDDNSLCRALHRHRAGVLKRLLAALGVLVARGDRRGGAGCRPQRQRLLHQPAREPALDADPPDPAERGPGRALLAGADRADHHLRPARASGSQIDNAEVDWNRLALLRGRVDVNRLSAERVTWMRRASAPAPARTLPTAEAQPFALPELPVSVRLRELAFPDVRFEEPVFGQAAELAATGSLRARERRARHRDRRHPPRRARAASSRSRPPSPTRPASSTSTSGCRSRRAASSPPCSRSRARPRSTSACRARGRSTRST